MDNLLNSDHISTEYSFVEYRPTSTVVLQFLIEPHTVKDQCSDQSLSAWSLFTVNLFKSSINMIHILISIALNVLSATIFMLFVNTV